MNMTTVASVAAPVGFCQRCPTRNYCAAADLQPVELELLPQIMHLGRSLPKGAHAFRAGDPVDGEYHVRSGTLKTYFTSHSGVECVTGFYLPGEILPGFKHGGYHTHSAAALDNASICMERPNADRHERAEIQRLLGLIRRHHYHVSSVALKQQINLHATTARARFAGFCVDMMERLHKLERNPTFISTPMSRTDIANFLGLTLESLSRAISALKREGVITADRQAIEIVQPQTLRKMAPHLC